MHTKIVTLALASCLAVTAPALSLSISSSLIISGEATGDRFTSLDATEREAIVAAKLQLLKQAGLDLAGLTLPQQKAFAWAAVRVGELQSSKLEAGSDLKQLQSFKVSVTLSADIVPEASAFLQKFRQTLDPEETKPKSAKAEAAALPAPPPALQVKASLLTRAAPDTPATAVQEGAQLQQGQHFQLQLTPNRDCHAYLLLLDAKGRLLALYPGPIQGSQLKGGATYEVPGPGLYYRAEEAVDRALYLIAAPERQADIEHLIQLSRKNQDPQLPLMLQALFEMRQGLPRPSHFAQIFRLYDWNHTKRILLPSGR